MGNDVFFFKCKTELINLDFKPWIRDVNYKLFFINEGEIEDIYHFDTIRPQLKEIRIQYLYKNKLNREKQGI